MEDDAMNNEIIKISIFFVVSIAWVIWWWNTVKQAESKKYLRLLGASILIGGISYIIGRLFDFAILASVVFIAFPSGIYFYIKTLLSEHRVGNKST